MKKIILFLFVLISTQTYSQLPFDCNDGKFYQVISGALKAYDPITGSYSEALHTYSTYNAGGYNPIDNYLYAIKSSDKHLLRIGKESITDLGAIAPNGTVVFGGGYAADVDKEGNLWVFQNNTKNTFHKITNLKDLNGQTAPTFEIVNVPTKAPSTCADITYINGSFYGGSQGNLFKWDLSTGTPLLTNKPVNNLPRSTFGAAYTDNSNRLYLSDNNGGLYLVTDYETNPTASLLNLTEVTNSNDGFKCANGISPVDKDQDGILDTVDSDTDGDGIPNIVECKGLNPYGDDDGDGMYNYLDNDLSGNGDNVVQHAFDSDSDGIPDFFDSDSDNDGIYDIAESANSTLDTNNDGIYNNLDVSYNDTDLDGLADAFDKDHGGQVNLIDSDKDGVYNVYDIDSDNDGIVDIIEGQIATNYLPLSHNDIDNDGMDDNFDIDFGGVANGFINTDQDALFDYLDNDSDNNGILDTTEAYDSDNDGVSETTLSGIDTDNDGLDDSFDLMKSSFVSDNGGQTPNSFPVTNLCDRYRYLGDFNSEGTPLYLEQNDIITPETLKQINNALPESYPVPDFNPHYISSGYNTNVNVKEQTEVWVTFVSEGAGYKNTLGFYTYDIQNPLTTSPKPEDITIIFPNVSAKSSGGQLETGNKVKIGSFPPNTAIGWVLLANAWSDGCVGAGNWSLFSNPEFNPEKKSDLQYHNVLLSDVVNERIILGFEDIRRDYASCDQDFNDALFYITSSKYSAIQNDNYAEIENPNNNVSSANDGGLESNGDLAKLIAQRNFNRTKRNSFHNKKSTQLKFTPGRNLSAKGVNSQNQSSLNVFFPSTGMFGTENTFVSSPNDLIKITNAEEVFAIDYYQDEARVAAAFATATTGSVYDHSKIICDRLNGSSLRDVRTLSIRNHTIINTKIKRANGEIEQALTFSVKIGGTVNELYSFWNIDQYPSGDYLNFQLWGSSIAQVANIANHVIDQLTKNKNLISNTVTDQVPAVFVQNGTYKNGKILLNITNKSQASSLKYSSNLRRTELSNKESVTKILSLSGAYNETLIVDTGYLFDIGISVTGINSERSDALYLADGPWGIDYDTELATVNSFTINAQNNPKDTNNYIVERDVVLKGEVKGTINVFRNILAGELTLNIKTAKAIEFTLNNNTAVEVILVPKVLDDWSNRLRHTIKASNRATTHTLCFDEFKNALGNTLSFNEIRSVVFSVQGNYVDYNEFSLAVSDLRFIENTEKEITLQTEEVVSIPTLIETKKPVEINSYPNPFTTSMLLNIPENKASSITIQVIDVTGKTVRLEKIQAVINEDYIFKRKNLNAGLYKYVITNAQGKNYKGSFMIK